MKETYKIMWGIVMFGILILVCLWWIIITTDQKVQCIIEKKYSDAEIKDWCDGLGGKLVPDYHDEWGQTCVVKGDGSISYVGSATMC